MAFSLGTELKRIHAATRNIVVVSVDLSVLSVPRHGASGQLNLDLA